MSTKPAGQKKDGTNKDGAKKEKGLLAYIGLGLSYGLFVLVLLVGAAAVIVPMVTGSTPMTVLTNSMAPAYPAGTLIIVEPTKVDDIRIGDVVTFQLKSDRPEVVTHRVIGIGHNAEGELNFTTKGDNNDAPDADIVRPVQVRGTLWYSIPYIGYVNTIVSGENKAWILPIVALALLIYAGYMFASSLVGRSKRKAKEADSEERAEERARLRAEAEALADARADERAEQRLRERLEKERLAAAEAEHPTHSSL